MDETIDDLSGYAESLKNYLIENSPQLIAAVVIMIAGFFAAGFVARFVSKICAARRIDITLSRFFAGAAKLTVLILFVVMAINRIGVEITPLVALLGASAFGLSLAVQGPVSNYGAGIVLIITRPFKVGDTLTIHDRTGLVDSINLGNTQLQTEDGQQITIPNRQILGEILTNSFQLMVVEGVVGIDYKSDPETAIAAVTDALKSIPSVSTEIVPQVGIQAFGDSAIEIGYRYWVATRNYYTIQYAVNLAVFKALKSANIPIPFPQRDIHIVTRPK